jgi:Fe-S-cluster-containing dehydrogenase component
MFKRMGFLFDPNLCIGCRSCEMACRNQNHTPPAIHWRKVTKISSGVYLSMSCNHCESPECFRVCPERAFTKRKDGIVEINPSLCNGCLDCIDACPIHAPQHDPETNKVTRCNMCYQRQDTGMLPACVEACTTGALQIADLNQINDADSVKTLPGLENIQLTHPSILFKSLQEGKRYLIREMPLGN